MPPPHRLCCLASPTGCSLLFLFILVRAYNLKNIRAAQTCSNGISGIEHNGACCPVGCGRCGGSGCATRAIDIGLGKFDCCVGKIKKKGVSCDESGEAPCFV